MGFINDFTFSRELTFSGFRWQLKDIIMEIIIESGQTRHLQEILDLYRRVAVQRDGIIRHEHEITHDYIQGFLEKSLPRGLILLARKDTMLIGEIHAYIPDIYAFRHILSDLTIVVHPDYQGMGVGRKLFTQFLNTVKDHHRHIYRIELFVRAHNHQSHAFYQSLGFVDEGRHEKKILTRELTFETPIHMAWFNPYFDPGCVSES